MVLEKPQKVRQDPPGLALLTIGITCTIAVFLIVLEASHSSGWQAVFNANNFMRMDSGLYLSIVERGYEFISCKNIPGMDPQDHCGNCGWFPAYPALVYIGTLMSLPMSYTAIGVSFLFTYALAVLVLLIVNRAGTEPWLQKLLVLFCALFFSGQIYFFAVFPLSMAVAFILTSMLFYQAKKETIAAIFAAAAVFCYPGATWYVGSLALARFFSRSDELLSKASLLTATSILAIGSVGFLAVIAIHHVAVGHWDAFFLTQAKYDHHIHWPFNTIAWQFEFPYSKNHAHYHIQMMNFTRALVLALAAGICWKYRRRLKDIDRLALLQGFFAWLMPLIVANPHTLASLRSGTLMLPVVIVLRYLPAWALAPIVCFLAYQATNTAKLFFANHLP